MPPRYECRHVWQRISDDQDRCAKCGTMQMSMGLAVDIRPKVKPKKTQNRELTPGQREFTRKLIGY